MKKLLIPVIVVITLLSCKKKENAEKSYSIYGELGRGMVNNASDSIKYLGAIFFTDRQKYKTTEVESVLVNNIVLDNESISYGKIFIDTPGFDIKEGVKWKVVGKGDIPSFEYEDKRPVPQLMSAIPDTMFIADGLTFKLKMLNTDSVQIRVQEYNGFNGLTRRFSAHSDEFILPQDVISLIFRNGYYVEVEILLFAQEEIIIDDKKFIFYTENKYTENCVLW